jgi:hypothetical protein
MANLKISMQNPDSKTRQRTENKMSGMGFGLGINSNFYHFSKKVAVGTLDAAISPFPRGVDA